MVQKIPQGFNTITPTLVVDGANKAIDLYIKALGAKEDYRMNCPQTGKVMHACLTVGDSKLFLSDPFPEMGCATPTNSTFYLYLEDVDAAFKQATSAGFKSKSEPQDMFYGDRTGAVTDPYGNIWTFATHVRDVSEADMEKAVKDIAKGKKAA
jgi:uncharacterized glyoxalase superfamily protein PhnB